MADPRDSDRDWLNFRSALERAIGVPLAQYKEPQMKRRLASIMGRYGVASWPEFSRRITSDERVLAVVRDTLTINVSEFFRQPDRFRALQEHYLPQMIAERRALKLWSAGCSIGCEPYTLSIVLNEVDPAGRHSVLATDVDMPALSRAQDGRGYLPSEVRSVPPELLQKYFTTEADGTYRVVEEVKRRVTFRRHDLLKDPYPTNMDLILCRNVVIYFTDEAKRYIYRRFADALRPGGYLFIGGSEMIMSSRELGLVASSTSIYQKAA
ncbi:MAG: protein-glutamate O-methyltransferase CheR [Dehalococcoidia bacterium]